jgi:hypothetical protein
VFALTNETEQNLQGVRLVLHVPGDATATEPDDERPGLSEPPRPYGPRRKNNLDFGAGLDFPSAAHVSGLHFPAPGLRSGVDIENGGSVRLRFDPSTCVRTTRSCSPRSCCSFRKVGR